jgi:hypothetical protein
LELDAPGRGRPPPDGSARVGRPPLAGGGDELEEGSMTDIVFLALSILLFYAAIRYTRWSDRV